MAQVQTLPNYQAIIGLFQKKHTRGVKVFHKIYKLDQHSLFFILMRREWKRWYAYKVCIKTVELALKGTEAWVADNLSAVGKMSLRKKCRKAVQALHYVKDPP